MYDAREKAIRDRQWDLSAARREGQIEGKLEGKLEGKREGMIEGAIAGEIKLIRVLQGILQIPVSDQQELSAMRLEQLESLTNRLQEKARNRNIQE